MYQKSYVVLSGNYKRKVVIKVFGNVGGPINLSDWLVVKRGCLVFLEPLDNGDSIVTVLGP